MMFFFLYSIPYYIEITSLYNPTSLSFQFLISVIINSIGILSLFKCIESLQKDTCHKHYYGIKTVNKTTSMYYLLIHGDWHIRDHLETPIFPEASTYAHCDPKHLVFAEDSDTMYTCTNENKNLIKTMLTEITIKQTNYMHACKIYDFAGMVVKTFITCQKRDKPCN